MLAGAVALLLWLCPDERVAACVAVAAAWALIWALWAQRRRTEARLVRQARRERARRLEGLTTLAGGVAHDFNNVLAGVLGNAELLQDGLPKNSPLRDDVRAILAATDRAADLADQLLACAGGGVFHAEPIDVVALVDATAARIRERLSESVHLTLTVEADLPVVQANRRRLRSALERLLENAAEALETTGGRIEVSAQTTELNGTTPSDVVAPDALSPGRYLTIAVQDDGPGMDDATRERVFDPFYSTRFPGRGLGLPAALGALRSHGGTVQVASSPGAGATFTLLLPLDRPPSGRPERAGR